MDSVVSPSQSLLNELDGIADPGRWLGAARERREAGDLDTARTVLTAAVERFPRIAAIRHDYARLHEACGDWPAAEQCWRAFIGIEARTWWGHAALANTLREQGRITEAETILTAEIQHQPDEPALPSEYARLAERCGDWTQASRRWDAVQSRFPDVPEGYTGQARALRALGRPDDAQALLLRALERFPQNGSICHDLGRLAEANRDWPAAERWWRAFLAIDPRPWWAHTALANALREQGRFVDAEAVLAEQIVLQPGEPALAIEYARFADRQSHWDQALQRWDAAIARFPNTYEAYCGAARALRELGRSPDAKTLLLQAAQRFPNIPVIRHDLAQLAEAERDWPAAEDWWRAFIKIDPRPWWAHTALAHALRQQGSAAAIEALHAAQRVFPSEPAVFAMAAQWAAQDRRFAEAAALWADFRNRFETNPAGYIHGAQALIELGDVAGARSVLQRGTEILPDNIDLLVARADAPSRQNDHAESLRLWRELAADHPRQTTVAVGLAQALERCGKMTEALAVVENGLRTDPTAYRLMQLAMMLNVRERGVAAGLEAALRFQASYPDDELGYTVAADALVESWKVATALEMLQDARRRLPNAFGILQALIRLAARYREADPERLTRILASIPPTPRHCASILNGLRHAGALQEAHAFIATLDAPDLHSRDVLPEATRIALDVGDYDRAVELGTKLTAITEFADEAHVLIGLAYRRKADWPAAQKSLAKHAASLPASVPFWNVLLESSVIVGRPHEVMDHWRELRKSNRMSSQAIADTAYALLASAPSEDLVNEAIDVMLSESDDGSPDWLPVIIRVAHLIHPRFGPTLPELIKLKAGTLDEEDVRPSASIFRSICGYRLSETVLARVIADCSRQGRLGLLSSILRSQDRRYCKPIVSEYLMQVLASVQHGASTALEMHTALHLAAIYSYQRFAELLTRAASMTPNGEADPFADLSTPSGVIGYAARTFAKLAAPAVIASRTRRLRVAVCVSGQLRGYQNAFRSWSGLNLGDVDADIFVHTWRDVGYKWSRLFQISLLKDYPNLMSFIEDPDQGQVFLKNYYPSVLAAIFSLIAGRSVATESALLAFYGARDVVIEDDAKIIERNANIWKLHTKIERCHLLARATNETYDLFLRIRPDLILGNDTALDWDRLAFDCYDKNIVYSDAPHEFSAELIRIGDQLAVARPDVMDRYASLASTLEAAKLSGCYRYQTPRAIVMHRSIALHLIQNGIVARRLASFAHGGFADLEVTPRDVIEPLLADVAARAPAHFDDEFLRACGVSDRLTAMA